MHVAENYMCGSAVCKAVCTHGHCQWWLHFLCGSVLMGRPTIEGDVCAHMAVLLWVMCVCMFDRRPRRWFE